jgi:chorismate lyase / 3-hydroxybenzoate synthase
LRNQSGHRILTAQLTVNPLQSEPPAWVEAMLPIDAAALHPLPNEAAPDSAGRRASRESDGIQAVARADLLRTRVQLRGARSLDAEALAASVQRAYLALGRFVRGLERHPIRIWNFVPGIGDRFGALDRYMVFNRGRFEALARLDLEPRPTSSAVGVESDDLVIEMLAAATPGTAVENPRQISSWNYSPCYGPTPPCFARATVAALAGRRWLLIGGTASIVGEESCHPDNVGAQLDETFANLCAVIESVAPRTADPLMLIEDARVYVARPEHASEIADAVQRRFDGARRIELALSTVCRPELLVEIEGRVSFAPRPA